MKIFISTTSFGEYDKSYLDVCRKSGISVESNPYGRKMKPEELCSLAQGAVGLIAGTEPLTADVLSKMPNLKVISRCGVGLENVDLDAAEKAGIKVFNTPDAPTRAVAELTIGLMLDILRKTSRMDSAIRSGRWEKLMGNLLYGKKVGIIGFGRIGRAVAGLLKAFDCEIAYADPFVDDGLLGLRRLSKHELLCWAEIVSIHVASKERIMSRGDIEMMKRGGWIINVSRGEAVDEVALYDSLKSGDLCGAAIDVFEQEPYKGPLAHLDNVVLTPHIGSYAKEARTRMELEAVNNLIKGLNDREGI